MLANKIKGLTLEIGGDTTQLNKALGDVNKQSKSLQSELRQVDKLLKIDPKNTELLAQKQKLLTESIGTTAKKLDTLKTAEKQAQEQFKQGKISEDQYRALQREIIGTEQELKKLESQAIKSNAVLSKDDAVKNLKNIGKVAAGAGAALGAALLGSAVAAGKSADEINTLAKQTGLSTEEIQKFKYASDLIDVSLETLTGSMAKNIKSMKAVQDGTKLSVDAYKALGVEVLNADGSLRDGQDVFNEVINALGKMENETERDALAMQILGRSAQDLNPLILGGADALKQYGDEAEAAGLILSQEALDGANAFNDGIDKIKATAAGMFAKIGGEVAENLLPQLNLLLEWLINAPAWFEENKTMLQLIGVVIGTLTALVIAFNVQQLLMASGMTLWTAVGAVATTVTGALGVAVAFLASPISLAIIGIGLLIAAGILLYKNWDTIKEKALEIWDKITTGIGGAAAFIKNIFTVDLPAAFATLVEMAKTPLNALLSMINNIIGGINMLINGLNSISFDIPSWVPKIGGKSFGISIPTIPEIPLLAKGGVLHSGSAIVGEAGPELLSMLGGRAVVTPLTGNNAGASVIMNNTFNNYQPRDGERVARDLNRRLGRVYG